MPPSLPSADPSRPTLAWLESLGWGDASVEPLAGDVSPRRYYRLRRGAERAVLATYPDAADGACERFARAARLLEEESLRVPRRRAVDCSGGRMLLEDLGAETLFDRRRRGWSYLAPRIELAAAIADRISALPAPRVAALNPPLDHALLADELAYTCKLAGRVADARVAPTGGLAAALDVLLERLVTSPLVPCHRDFMARNLMPLDGELALIDFQDLRLGPRSYDLASLLNDSLYAPPELEESLVERFAHPPAARLGYHRAAAQRTLKIVGTFLGFARRGVPRYLPLVEPTLERSREHLHRLPEIRPVGAAADRLIDDLRSVAAAL